MFTVTVVQPGATRGIDITERVKGLTFQSVATGGYGSCSFTVAGDLAVRRQRLLPIASTLRVTWEAVVAWEGRIEDYSDWDPLTASVTILGFGNQRLLTDVSLKEIWSLRSIPWQPSVPVAGLDTVNGTTPELQPAAMFATVGTFDPSDRTRVGVLVDNYSGVPTSNGYSNWALWIAPSNVYINRLLGKVSNAISSRVYAQVSADGATWHTIVDTDPGVTPTETEALVDVELQACQLLIGSMATGSGNNGIWEDIRILCTALDEDVEGGFYAHSLLADIIARVPGLTAGRIDDTTGPDFQIPSLSRTVRDTARSLWEEVVAFYTNEWGVWDDGQVDWMPANLDEPQWIVTLDKFAALKITSSLDDIAKTVYLLYENAATGEASEASSTSTSQRNPVVKGGLERDLVYTAPVPMTPTSAARLAEIIARARGDFPMARGKATLAASTMISHADGLARPAGLLRAGQNLVIPDMPRDDVLTTGRDGQSLFHIISATVSLDRNTVDLEFDSYGRGLDVTLARITAATRVLTG